MTDIKFYVNSEGNTLGAFDDGGPDGAIEVPFPEDGSQIWQFPGWGPNITLLKATENQWRDQQMPIASNNVTSIQFGEEGVPGTEQQWKDYWLTLRKWTTDNPDFPDSAKRPVAPT